MEGRPGAPRHSHGAAPCGSRPGRPPRAARAGRGLGLARAHLDGGPPSLVIHSAGFDALLGDPLGGFTLLAEDYATITRGIAARATGAPACGVLEGGYDPERVAEAVVRHVLALADDGTPDMLRA